MFVNMENSATARKVNICPFSGSSHGLSNQCASNIAILELLKKIPLKQTKFKLNCLRTIYLTQTNDKSTTEKEKKKQNKLCKINLTSQELLNHISKITENHKGLSGEIKEISNFRSGRWIHDIYKQAHLVGLKLPNSTSYYCYRLKWLIRHSF